MDIANDLDWNVPEHANGNPKKFSEEGHSTCVYIIIPEFAKYSWEEPGINLYLNMCSTPEKPLMILSELCFYCVLLLSNEETTKSCYKSSTLTLTRGIEDGLQHSYGNATSLMLWVNGEKMQRKSILVYRSGTKNHLCFKIMSVRYAVILIFLSRSLCFIQQGSSAGNKRLRHACCI